MTPFTDNAFNDLHFIMNLKLKLTSTMSEMTENQSSVEDLSGFCGQKFIYKN